MLILTTILTGTIGGFRRFYHALDCLAGRHFGGSFTGGAFHHGGERRLLPHLRPVKEDKNGHVAGRAPCFRGKVLRDRRSASYLLELPAPLTQVLLFPQLINALIGGAAAAAVGFYLARILKTASVQ